MSKREYSAFIKGKAKVAPSAGFACGDLPATLFSYQRDLVRWACRRGRAALFADTGLGKSRMQVAWASQVHAHTASPVLILAPLAVAEQTRREGAAIGVDITHLHNGDEHIAGVCVVNYERLHRVDVSRFSGVVLDESSILKHHDSKTRGALIESFRNTPYRLACTATPAPNDLEELGNHCEFLGICSRIEMLAEFFCHDGGETQTWRLKGHARDAFWRWLCSWAAVIRKPSDLGDDDSKHVLPPLRVHEHMVEDASGFAHAQGVLFTESLGLSQARAAGKATLEARVRKTAELVAGEPSEPWLIWCETNTESSMLASAISGAVEIVGSDKAEAKEQALDGFTSGRIRVLVTKPSIAGFGLNFQHCARMAFVGLSYSFESYYQAVRRCWRFGQSRAVDAHIITSDIEGSVLATIKRKQSQAIEVAEQMSVYTREHVQREVRGAIRETNTYNPMKTMTLPSWLRSEVAA